MSDAPNLDSLQRWMLEVITDPNGAERGLSADKARECIDVPSERLGDVIRPSLSRTPLERLSVYADMYFWRLLDVLAENFAAVRVALGWDDFEAVMRAYISKHPSRSFTLSHLGQKLPEYLATSPLCPDREFVSDLARIERACDEVFDAPRSPRLATAALEAVPPQSWGEVRLRTISALTLLELAYPANTYVQSVRDGEDAEKPQRAPAWLVVRRDEELKVWRAELTQDQYRLLRGLQDGLTLADALEATALHDDANVDEIMGSVGEWFRKWTALGFFAGLDRP